MKRTDISGIDDIKLMVDEFYAKVREDELLSPIFSYRISDYWQPHLEIMYKFWNAALFGVKDYAGNPFIKHINMGLNDQLFERWLQLFSATVQEHFDGPVSEEAIKRAIIMAAMFRKKLSMITPEGAKPIL